MLVCKEKLSKERLFKVKEKLTIKKVCACSFFLRLPAEGKVYNPQIEKSKTLLLM